jgi:hypothetical protein
MPAAPGLYRLVTTLHDAKGVAFDLATQSLVPALIVRVTGEADVAFRVRGSAVVKAGEALELPVVIKNLGTAAWGSDGSTGQDVPWESKAGARAMVVGQWVGLLGSVAPSADAGLRGLSEDDELPSESDAMAVGSVLLPSILAPGESAEATLKVTAPGKAGRYLLLLDVVVPGKGSLTAAGAEPALVRVDVR